MCSLSLAVLGLSIALDFLEISLNHQERLHLFVFHNVFLYLLKGRADDIAH
jgi:hypothetical protein